ncbi:MAG: hypothetical protein H8E55_25475 [Pelagibacterales bacterium]|nr:hypothetical protein [Pelagibacterales bacterium]
MKKLMLCSILSVLFINSYSQDTICTYFTGERIIEFDYQTSEIISETEMERKSYTIDVGYREVLCLDLSDGKKRFRKVITTYDDGEQISQKLESKDNVYYSPIGPVSIEVRRPTIL